MRLVFVLLVCAALPMAAPVDAQPLDERTLENLVTFARVTGCVRYFHPAAAVERTDWHAFTAAAVSEVERTRDLNALLTRLYPPVASRLGPFVTRVVRWEHRGIVTGPRAPANGFLSARITRWRVGLALRVVCIALAVVIVVLATVRRHKLWFFGALLILPAFLPGGELETWKAGPMVMPLELPASVADAYPPFVSHGAITPRSQRLASVIAVWNLQQHFYPYFDQVKVDWPAALRRALRKAAVDPDDRAFVETLSALGHDLRDSHAWVKQRGVRLARLPLEFAWIEERVVVTAVAEGIEDVRVGDVVETFNGQPVRDVVARLTAISPGSHDNAARHLAVVYRLPRGERGATARITFDNGQTRELAYATYKFRPRYAPIADVAPGIMRVDLGTANPDLFRAALPRLERARGIVFVLELYPHEFPEAIFLRHLLDEPVLFWEMQLPLARWPDRHRLAWADLPDSKLEPLAPRLRAKTAFIVSPRTVSYAEHVVDAVQFHKLGKVIGEPTAGAFGAYSWIALPNGIQFDWTAARANRLDGSVLHGRGVIPDVIARPTIAGVRAGRDELLEAAIATLR